MAMPSKPLLLMQRASRYVVRCASLLMLLIAVSGAMLTPALAGDLYAPEAQGSSPHTHFIWWLVQESDDQVVCQIIVQHAGRPTAAEVHNACGAALYDQWVDPQACTEEREDDEKACSPLYLQFHTTRQVSINLSPQVNYCSQILDGAPLEDILPRWLRSPSQLASNVPYTYLAGRLLTWDVVDGSACPWNGLLPNGSASACGLEQARDAVAEWQNRFDPRIMQVTDQTGVSSQLMKNMIAQESQFWPGLDNNINEYGLIQMTAQGADTLLMWNPRFYTSFCPLALSPETCGLGYPQLSEENQALLRGALAVKAGAECADCPFGVDFKQADYGIQILGQALLANCEQVEQIIYNETYGDAYNLVAYEDFWRLVLVNYNAGPGCLSKAVSTAWIDGMTGMFENRLYWYDVADALSWGCRDAEMYVEKVAR